MPSSKSSIGQSLPAKVNVFKRGVEREPRVSNGPLGLKETSFFCMGDLSSTSSRLRMEEQSLSLPELQYEIQILMKIGTGIEF